MKRRQDLYISAVAPAALLSSYALAHESKAHAASKNTPVPKEQKDWGIAGDAKSVNRTVEVGMADNMRFTPDKLSVKLGETIRFKVRNKGKVMHEFVIGTKKKNAAHAEMMIKFPKMEHDEPYMAHVAQGKTGQIIGTFNRSGEFEFACLIAGHFQAGMVGQIKVKA